MIISTAGHIDHGKTALVRALTGVDTDRLPEEKRRGITIDLGFAYLRLPSSKLLGFVDVPGHEHFVRTMVAGASGVDFALLVIAADDGVKPQTVEHLRILHVLGVGRGAVAITKADKVDEGRLRKLAPELSALVSKFGWEAARTFPVSAKSGRGIEALKAFLVREAERFEQAKPSNDLFRYAIDRAFSVPGSGLVVTGHIVGGTVRRGDRLVHVPSGREVRVRGIRQHDASFEAASAGDRCALNLSGLSASDIRRGHLLNDGRLLRSTTRLVARLSNSSEPVLGEWVPVHVHAGTASLTGRMARLRTPAHPGAGGVFAKIDLDAPSMIIHGDRIVLRDTSARRTLGGGVVIDPQRPKRASARYVAAIEAWSKPAAAEVLRTLAEIDAVDLARFETAFALTPDAVRATIASSSLKVFGEAPGFALPASGYDAIRARVLARLGARQPDGSAPRLRIDTLRREPEPALAPDAFAALLRELSREGLVLVSGGRVELAGESGVSDPTRDIDWQRLKRLLQSGNFDPLSVRELAERMGHDLVAVRTLLERRARVGEVLRVSAERFFPMTTVRRLTEYASRLAGARPDRQFTVTEFRDAIGTGRILASDILEALDAAGITRRHGNRRSLGIGYVALVPGRREEPRTPLATSPSAPGWVAR